MCPAASEAQRIRCALTDAESSSCTELLTLLTRVSHYLLRFALLMATFLVVCNAFDLADANYLIIYSTSVISDLKTFAIYSTFRLADGKSLIIYSISDIAHAEGLLFVSHF